MSSPKPDVLESALKWAALGLLLEQWETLRQSHDLIGYDDTHAITQSVKAALRYGATYVDIFRIIDIAAQE